MNPNCRVVADFPPCLTAYQLQRAHTFPLFRQTCLLIHCCCQFYSATLFLLNVLCSRQIADFRQAAPPTLSYLELMNMQSTQCVQNKTAFNCGKNRANSFGRFEQSNVVTSVFWAILYFSGVCVCV